MAQSNDSPRSVPPKPPAEFSAAVDGMTIADLIHAHCLSGTRAAFEVRSEKQRGTLFFDKGRLVHAELGGLDGVRAVAMMLGLNNRSFRPSSAPWPTAPTIDGAWDTVLQQATRELDDFERDEASSQCAPAPLSAHDLPTRPASVVPAPNRVDDAPPSGTPPAPASGIRLDALGVLVTSMGPKAEAVAETAAFVSPLATLLGEELGLGDILAVDVACHDERGVLLCREPPGSWIGACGTAKQLAALRKRIGSG